MAAPTSLFALGLTLRPEHPTERRLHVAHLAGRLGYASVWLPLGEAAPTPEQLRGLAERALPARVGVVVPPGAPAHPAMLATLPATVLVELDPPGAERAEAVAAVGGPNGWRSRVHVRGFDPDAAGSVVAAEGRDGLARALAGAAAARSAAGQSAARQPLTAVLTVSIGRTAREAEARALRDPTLAAAGQVGLFGTLEQAQEQALALRRAGADAIRAILADEWDLADLLAQLRAVAVGPTPLLHARRTDA